MKTLMLVGVLMLGACQNSSTTTTAVYDSKEALLAADTIALRYLAQPPCNGPAVITCVDSGIKARIKSASAAVTAARHAVNAAIVAGQTPDDVSLTAAIGAFAATVAPFQSLVK